MDRKSKRRALLNRVRNEGGYLMERAARGVLAERPDAYPDSFQALWDDAWVFLHHSLSNQLAALKAAPCTSD
jgi:hypothetical protein